MKNVLHSKCKNKKKSEKNIFRNEKLKWLHSWLCEEYSWYCFGANT